jgi:hypothetical protein
MSKVNLHEMFQKQADEQARKIIEAQDWDEDCLCSRTQPGTPVGECVYHRICGCTVHDIAKQSYTAALSDLQDKVDGLLNAFSKLIKTIPYNSIEPDYLIEAKQALAKYKKDSE